MSKVIIVQVGWAAESNKSWISANGGTGDRPGTTLNMKKVSRGLSRVEAGNPGFPRLAQVTSGGFSWWLPEGLSVVTYQLSHSSKRRVLFSIDLVKSPGFSLVSVGLNPQAYKAYACLASRSKKELRASNRERYQWFNGLGGRGLSGLHGVWCTGRGPHLQLRLEPQGTSDFRPRSQGPCRLGTHN